MKPESQHLDFLISQYVDGCLDGASKKSVEQQLLTDPAARKLYEEHREVQDLLDDWGNRIPLINWDEFDQKLALKLARENVGVSRYTLFRRWMRPVAAAAALFIAASIGYSWHAWWGPKPGHVTVIQPPAVVEAHRQVGLPDMPGSTQPSIHTFRVVEGNNAMAGERVRTAVAVSGGAANDAARDVLAGSVFMGLDLSDSQRNLLDAPQGGVAVTLPEPRKEQTPGVSFP